MVELTQFNVLKTVFYYSLLIILAPVVTFFGVKSIVFEVLLTTSTVASNVWSAIAAVIVLHIALALYIYRAYSDPRGKSEKDDKID